MFYESTQNIHWQLFHLIRCLVPGRGIPFAASVCIQETLPPQPPTLSSSSSACEFISCRHTVPSMVVCCYGAREIPQAVPRCAARVSHTHTRKCYRQATAATKQENGTTRFVPKTKIENTFEMWVRAARGANACIRAPCRTQCEANEREPGEPSQRRSEKKVQVMNA